MFFSFCPIAYGFATGQDHALILLLFALVMIHLYEGKDLRAGCFLGFALFKFQLVLPFVLILVLKLSGPVIRDLQGEGERENLAPLRVFLWWLLCFWGPVCLLWVGKV